MNLTHHHRNALRFSCAPVRGAWPFSDPNELYAHPFIPARVTSLGGYSLLYYDLRTGDVFCPDCAAFERFRARLHPDVHWEGAGSLPSALSRSAMQNTAEESSPPLTS